MQPTREVSKNVSMENLPAKRVLTFRERQSLEQASNVYGYADITAMGGNFIPGSNGASPVAVPWLSANRPRLNAQQKQVMQILKEGSPRPTTPEERDRLSKLASELKEKFTDPEWFQSRAECRVLKRDKPEFFTALEKAHKWDKPQEKLGGRKPSELAEAYRNIMRTLEPEDEMADSLDRLRRDK